MACNTCVEMTQLNETVLEENVRLKRTNKILRTVNGSLRRYLQTVENRQDEMFLAFCEESNVGR